MKTTIRGYKSLDFTTNDGKSVKGTKIYISFASSGTTGEETAAFFVPAEKALPKIVIGNSYLADFDNKGKLISISES